MQKLWADSSLMAALSVLVVLIISGSAVWLLLKWRESTRNAFETGESCLKEFEEMRLEGDITDEEYRKIRASVDGNASLPILKTDLTAMSKPTTDLGG